MEEMFQILRKYIPALKMFLINPPQFIAGADFPKKWNAVAFLILGGTASLVAAKINLSYYDERIRRVVNISDTVENLVFLFIAVGAFGLFIFLAFNRLGGHASLSKTLLLLAYIVAFTTPVLTLLLIIVTRLESACLDTTIVLVPPAHVVRYGDYHTTATSAYIEGAFATALLAWNLYLAYLLWLSFRALHAVNSVRAGVGMALAITGLFILSGPLGLLAADVTEHFRPLWDWIFEK